MEVLRHCFPPSVRRILQELPGSLDETYKRILREIREANQEHAHRLLQCLVAAVRPLRVEELAEVLAFDFEAEGIPKLNLKWRWEDQEEAVMSACSSLVVVVKNGDSRTVQFSHYSVKEFLTSSRLAESSRDVSYYHVLLERAHTIVAQACLGVLLGLDDRINWDSIKSFPLAEYAAEHWVRHAKFENVSSYIKDGVERLFDADEPQFSTWLWIYDPDYGRPMSSEFPGKPPAVPLYYAALLGFRELAEHLLSIHPTHAHVVGGVENTAFHASASRGHMNVLSLLIWYLPNVDIRGIWGQTALHRASLFGRVEIGRRLLSYGADVSAQDYGGWTPLFAAASAGQLEFARMLLKHRADVNIPDYNGRSPLYMAVKSRHVEVVRLLLEHGANPNTRDRFDMTPGELASDRGHPVIAQLLYEYGTEFPEKTLP